MTVKELRDALIDFDDDVEVMIKKTEILGTVGFINSVKQDTYGFFGTYSPCILLTDEFEPTEGDYNNFFTEGKIGKNDGT